ncbi:MAG: hypothetical protein Q9209_004406 [Squamulea sp. 1 TL-2023]
MTPSKGLANIPVELLDLVIEYLAVEQRDVIQRLSREPSVRFLDNQHKPLKQISLTCRSIRARAFTELFSHLRLRIHALRPYTNGGDKACTVFQGLIDLSRFIRLFHLDGRIRCFTLFFPYNTRVTYPVVDKLLAFVSGQIKLESVIIVGPPAVLYDLSYEMPRGLYNEWRFGSKLNVLYLKASPYIPGTESNGVDGPRKGLLVLRSWIEMKLNEGSNLPGYDPDHYPHQMASALPSFVGGPSDLDPPLLCFIRHFNYISLFPLANHMTILAKVLSRLPQLVCFSTRFLPVESTIEYDIVDPNDLGNNHDSETVGKANLDDVFGQTTEAYKILAEEIGQWIEHANLRLWTTTDNELCGYPIEFDDIVRPHLIGWDMTKPRVWEKPLIHVGADVNA